MKKTFKPINSLWIIAGLVGVYQLPVIENYLNQKDIITNASSYFSAPQEIQQFVENSKISISAKYAALTASENAPVVEVAVANTPIIQHTEILISEEPKLISKKSNSVENSVATSLSDKKEEDNIVITNKDSSILVAQIDTKDNQLAVLKPSIENNILIDKTEQPGEQNHTVSSSEYCKENCKVLMIGDSVMGDVEFSMIRLLKKSQPSWKVISGYKVSSGLTNQQYYDWPKVAEKLVNQYKPDYVLVLMGTNDAQNMIVNGKATVFGKEPWVEEYQRRVRLIVNNLEENSPYWLWVQLPTVKNNSFNQRLEIIRQAQSEGTENRILETKSILGENSQMVNMKLRANDGTHLNATGANLLAQHIYTKLTKDTE